MDRRGMARGLTVLAWGCAAPPTETDPPDPAPAVETDSDEPPAEVEDTGQEEDPEVRSELLGGLRYAPAGTLTRGCVEGRDDVDGGCDTTRASPAHPVTLSTPLWAMASEVTEGMWRDVFDGVELSACGADCPVGSVSWWSALAFANEASAREGLPACYALSACTGEAAARSPDDALSCASVSLDSVSAHPKGCEGWRLPTEAEWAYLARAGEDVAYAGADTPGPVAWFAGNVDDDGPREVCTKAPNGWGLCDMSGNVAEWTWDRWGPYASGEAFDPAGPPSGGARVHRGGSWASSAGEVRVATRGERFPFNLSADLGFRLVRSAP